MLRLLRALLPVLGSALRSRRDLVLENLTLRQQLATFASRWRPSIRRSDRVFWVTLRRLWSGWRNVLVIVQPETVDRWHRAGFRLYWARLSRRSCPPGRPPLLPEVRNLIRRMAVENGWGATRIHGELLHLGIDVSERSVSRYLRSLPRRPRPSQSWTTFLKNHRHIIAAMDLFTVPTATFRVLYVLFVIGHRRRSVAWFGVTTSPTAAWVVQQLREAFPFENVPRYLLLFALEPRAPGMWLPPAHPDTNVPIQSFPQGRLPAPSVNTANPLGRSAARPLPLSSRGVEAQRGRA